MAGLHRVSVPDVAGFSEVAEALPTGGVAAVARAGACLAAVLLSAGSANRPVAASQLAHAMVGALHALDGQRLDRHARIDAAVAAVVLSAALPTVERACENAIRSWTGAGIGCVASTHPRQLVARVLLALYQGDVDHATRAVHALCDADSDSVAGALHDWTVARVQAHGADRELQCFLHFRIAAAHAGLGDELLVLAAMVAARRAGVRAFGFEAWLEVRLATPGVRPRLRAAGRTRQGFGGAYPLVAAALR